MTPAWEVRTLRDWGVLRWWEEKDSETNNFLAIDADLRR
jgi:hypothetical protein